VSDNLLRQASEQMRRERRAGDDEDRFYNAVADWLAHTAKLVDNVPADVSEATPERVFANAFHVARAYLGEP